MNDSSQKATSAISVLLILASVLWGVVNIGGDLGSSRPPQSATIPYQAPGSQTVLARLWQDPFEVFRGGTNRDATLPPGRPKPSLADQVAQRTDGLAIIGVALEGTPYQADAEVRRRLRYAVEEALLSSGLVPEDRNLIGVQSLAITNATPRLVTDVPFEWFAAPPQALPSNLQHVLLLWLREDDFAEAPLPWLGTLLQHLLGNAGGDRAQFYFIGPRSSDTLRALATGATDGGAQFCQDLARAGRFAILSPEATAPDRFLLPNQGSPTDDLERHQLRGAIHTRLLGSGAFADRAATNEVFQNWIATDYQLAETIVAELDNRHARRLLGPGDVVAVVSEADTFYGRSLPSALELALTKPPRMWPATNFWRFSYLRGLEGQKPPGAKSEPKTAKSTASPEAALEASLQPTAEKAEGEAQLDYAARLGEVLHAKDREMRQGHGGRIFAVGLTGSDAYDKLVLLKALRAELPETLFFTTDLDARLWEPQELRYTRNLLVASAYPLAPLPGRDQFLPFRDAYQTAVFSATCGAVARARGESAGPLRSHLEGELYEIGRHGPVKLLPVITRHDAGTPVRVPEPESHSTGGSGLRLFPGWLRVFQVCAVTVGPLWLAWLLLGGFRHAPVEGTVEGAGWGAKRDRRPPLKALLWALLVVALMYLGGKMARDISQLPGEEPWALVDGISIWPTEAIRALAVILSIGFLLLTSRQYLRHREDLWKDYFSDQPFGPFVDQAASGRSDGGEVPGAVWPRVRAFLKSVQINSWPPPRIGDKVDARKLFADYIFLGATRHRYLRIVPQIAVYMLGAFSLVWLTGSLPDRLCVRGSASLKFDSVTLGLSVLLFLLVLFYVLDAARLTGKLLECLNQERTQWPEAVVQQSAAAKCVRPQDLDGWLDVQFAAQKTQETGRLMFYPFVLYLLLLLSRHSFFDNWTWPAGLVAIFVMNFILAAACWAFVRRAARRVRREALSRLTDAIALSATAATDAITTPGPAVAAADGAPARQGCVYSKDAYAKRLGELRTEIEQERRGAFSNVIQDPTMLALFIPTGVTGILTVLLHYWLNRP